MEPPRMNAEHICHAFVAPTIALICMSIVGGCVLGAGLVWLNALKKICQAVGATRGYLIFRRVMRQRKIRSERRA
jgi:hypothetical protein